MKKSIQGELCHEGKFKKICMSLRLKGVKRTDCEFANMAMELLKREFYS